MRIADEKIITKKMVIPRIIRLPWICLDIAVTPYFFLIIELHTKTRS
ncbi:MAG: hypothetical protein BAJATHORv1_60086 [Candidatus Thorarchaeota archaeon]|nr:MAG: hypothetical protein BAJATHORv1_60086 [Candidatus Thorarchaeota archaeon]